MSEICCMSHIPSKGASPSPTCFTSLDNSVILSQFKSCIGKKSIFTTVHGTILIFIIPWLNIGIIIGFAIVCKNQCFTIVLEFIGNLIISGLVEGLVLHSLNELRSQISKILYSHFCSVAFSCNSDTTSLVTQLKGKFLVTQLQAS